MRIPSRICARCNHVAADPNVRRREKLASIGDIYRDLVAIENEFDDVDYHLRDHWLARRPSRSSWRASKLGPFEIRLEWAADR